MKVEGWINKQRDQMTAKRKEKDLSTQRKGKDEKRLQQSPTRNWKK